jgi:NAD dependent epimerase/dehydratase family enzyme
VPAPSIALRLAFGELAEMLLLGQRVVPARALAQGFTFRYPQIERALENLFGRE